MQTSWLRGNLVSRVCLFAGLVLAMNCANFGSVLAGTDDQAQARLDDALHRLDGLIAGDTPGTDAGMPNPPDTGIADPEKVGEPSAPTAPPTGFVAMYGACLLNSLPGAAPYEMRWSGERGYRITVDPGSYWCHWRQSADQTLSIGYNGHDRALKLGKAHCESVNQCSAMREFARYRLEPFEPLESAAEFVGYPSGRTEVLPPTGSVAMQGVCIHNGGQSTIQYQAWWSGEAAFTITLNPGYTQCHWRSEGNQTLTLRVDGAQREMPLARVLCESINECSGMDQFARHDL